ncbi:MAG: hypothetical protein AMJ79_10880 [Phycisphaerae bacterium SM23_30]|nr:MAG: hypothetical protein AMJ79_10880 [Phycisphaerae bacterium SM23_30]
MSIKLRILSILFWSVISAAFIGPGTITTASKAGAVFGFDLLWALVFSTMGCLLLQEAAARITIASGSNLGQAITRQFEGKSFCRATLFLVGGSVIIGCAAYQAGNLLGAVEGLALIFDIRKVYLVLCIGTVAFIALSIPSLQIIARLMGLIVAVMGICFLSTAILLRPSWGDLFSGCLIPTIPQASEGTLLIIGLIGTTIVPYNLFLGSGLSDKNQKIQEMRFGLSVAIILGGVISMAVLVVGTAITGEYSYPALAGTLTGQLGTWAGYLFGVGLFAAGFTSAITAPLASAITAQSLFGGRQPEKWRNQSLYFKLVWMAVLLIGLSFALAGFKPIPAIIVAQALNGLILPFISIFLLFVVNDPKLMGKKALNGRLSNIFLGLVVWVSLFLGLYKVFDAVCQAGKFARPGQNITLGIIMAAALLISAAIWVMIYAQRRRYFARENSS